VVAGRLGEAIWIRRKYVQTVCSLCKRELIFTTTGYTLAKKATLFNGQLFDALGRMYSKMQGAEKILCYLE
jgi:hypothetical protein